MRYRLITLGIVIAVATALSAQPTYRLHANGEIWVDRLENCGPVQCVKWYLLGNDPTTREITAGLGTSGGDGLKGYPDYVPLYQRRTDGTILIYTGEPCCGGACLGWKVLDPKRERNPAVSIFAAGEQLYQLRERGDIWSYNIKLCTPVGPSCPGWQQLDNSETVEITAVGRPAASPTLYQRRKTGEVLRYRGTPCSGTACWQLLGNNTDILELTATAAQGSAGVVHTLYQRRSDGIWRWRYIDKPCDGELCAKWEQIDNNSGTISIVTTDGSLYQLRNDGKIWIYLGGPGAVCSDTSCPAWQLVDEDSRTRQIAAGGTSFYKRHDNGAIWRYAKRECDNDGSACSQWQLLYDPTMSTIVSSQN